jgi:hypothetical protein|tara:strand:+ start:2209 stop:2451 length:243 start_codon:yes stop_codon:yes gene_type:complete
MLLAVALVGSLSVIAGGEAEPNKAMTLVSSDGVVEQLLIESKSQLKTELERDIKEGLKRYRPKIDLPLGAAQTEETVSQR